MRSTAHRELGRGKREKKNEMFRSPVSRARVHNFYVINIHVFPPKSVVKYWNNMEKKSGHYGQYKKAVRERDDIPEWTNPSVDYKETQTQQIAVVTESRKADGNGHQWLGQTDENIMR